MEELNIDILVKDITNSAIINNIKYLINDIIKYNKKMYITTILDLNSERLLYIPLDILEKIFKIINDIRKIYELLINKKIIEIDIRPINDDNIIYISRLLIYNKTIQILVLDLQELNCEGFKLLGNAIKENITIKSLNFTRIRENIKYFDNIINNILDNKNSNLSTLEFYDCIFNTYGSNQIVKLLNYETKITELNLYNIILNNVDIQRICQSLKNNNNLKILTIHNNNIINNYEHHIYIIEALKVNTSLIEINISGWHNNENTEGYASVLILNKTLKKIRFIDSKITNKGITYIAKALKINNTLENLSIDSSNYSYKALNKLVNVLIEDNESIIYLDLSVSKYYNYHYNRLHEFYTLKYMNKNAKLFIKLLKQNTNLKTLKINNYKIESENIYEIISTLYNNHTLEYIDISNNNIGIDILELIIDILDYNIIIKDMIFCMSYFQIKLFKEKYNEYINIIKNKLITNKNGLIVLNIKYRLLFDNIYELKLDMISGKQILLKISFEETLEKLFDIIKKELNFNGNIHLILPNNKLINNLEKKTLLINLLI
jgi:hypothetical protein